jgi:hypothetical protein
MLQITPVFVVPVTVEYSCSVPPAATVAVAGATLTVTAGITSSDADAFFVPSTTLVAVAVTAVIAFTLDGAEYNPVDEITPIAGLRLQITPVFVVPVTLALSCSFAPADTIADVGATVTFTPAGVGFTVSSAVPDCVVSATLVAINVTFVGAATLAGARYSPLVVTVPKFGEIVHKTLLFPVFVTVADACRLCPAMIDATEGFTFTVIGTVRRLAGGSEVCPKHTGNRNENKPTRTREL